MLRQFGTFHVLEFVREVSLTISQISFLVFLPACHFNRFVFKELKMI